MDPDKSLKRASEVIEDGRQRREKRRKVERDQFRQKMIFEGDRTLAFARWKRYKNRNIIETTHKSAMGWVFKELKKRTCLMMLTHQRDRKYELGPPTNDKLGEALRRSNSDTRWNWESQRDWLVRGQKEAKAKERWTYIWKHGRESELDLKLSWMSARINKALGPKVPVKVTNYYDTKKRAENEVMHESSSE